MEALEPVICSRWILRGLYIVSQPCFRILPENLQLSLLQLFDVVLAFATYLFFSHEIHGDAGKAESAGPSHPWGCCKEALLLDSTGIDKASASSASESAWTAEDINTCSDKETPGRVHLEACFEQKNMKKQYFNATSTNPIRYVVRQTKNIEKQYSNATSTNPTRM